MSNRQHKSISVKDTVEGCIALDIGLTVKPPCRRCPTEYSRCADSNSSSYDGQLRPYHDFISAWSKEGMTIGGQELVSVTCRQTSLVTNAFLLLIARPCFKFEPPTTTPLSTYARRHSRLLVSSKYRLRDAAFVLPCRLVTPT